METVNDKLGKVKDGALNNIVHSKLKDKFKDVLQFLDSKRDRTQFKGSVSGHRSTLESQLKHFTDIKVTSQTVRNDMTVSEQHAHVLQKMKQRKEKDLKTIAEGGG